MMKRIHRPGLQADAACAWLRQFGFVKRSPALQAGAARKNTRKQNITLLLLIALFFVINLDFLTLFPFVHSDESWLAGLTRNMLEQGSLGVTETFFDLKPRWPHAIKSIFHLLQMPFIAVFGYEVFSVRLLSLLGGCGALVLFYICARTMVRHTPALCATALLACDVQFVAAAHLARQEILLCCCILGCAAVFLRQEGALSTKSVVLLACITGAAEGLHPNSFLVAALCGSVLAVRCAVFKTASLRQLGIYTAVTGGLAALFVAASFAMDGEFIKHYLAYGESEFELSSPIMGRAAELGYFLKKLWHGVSGTYYVPNLKPQFVIFPLLLCAALFFAFKRRNREAAQRQRVLCIASAIGGLLLGTVLIGRYNQTSAVFFVPLFWLLLPFVCGELGAVPLRRSRAWRSGDGNVCRSGDGGVCRSEDGDACRSEDGGDGTMCRSGGGAAPYGISRQGRGLAVAVFAAVAVVVFSSAALCVAPWLSYSYSGYIKQISAFVPKESKVLGNLNSEFYFENGKLLDYRNLAYLKENNITVADYVRENALEYLIISDELEYIYSVRPKWNMIYGNVYNYRDELNAFIKASCTEVGSFVNNCYGVRIREQMNGDMNFTVHIYRVERP